MNCRERGDCQGDDEVEAAGDDVNRGDGDQAREEQQSSIEDTRAGGSCRVVVGLEKVESMQSSRETSKVGEAIGRK